MVAWKYTAALLVSAMGVVALFLNLSAPHRITLSCMATEAPAACYDSAVVHAYHTEGLENAVATLRQLRKMHPAYSYCHLVATKLGMYAVEDNPMSWEEAVSTSEDAALCSYGLMHGMIIGVFGAASHTIGIKEFPTNERLHELCESTATIGSRFGCYHGLGHFLMFVEKGKTDVIAKRCKEIAHGEFFGTRACIEGYFMQTYTRSLEEEMNLIRAPIEQPTKDTYKAWCSSFPDEMVQQACFREAWALYTQEELEQGSTVAALCESAQNTSSVEESYCYIRTSIMTLRNILHNDEHSVEVCRRYPREFQSLCFLRGAQMIIEEDTTQFVRGIRRCELVRGEDGRRCSVELASMVGRLFTPEQKHMAEAFCRRFKDTEARTLCK